MQANGARGLALSWAVSQRGPNHHLQVRIVIEALASRVDFEWLRRAIARVDELVELGRRNIQKSIAFDAFAASLRSR